jgi:hypothetical protein
MNSSLTEIVEEIQSKSVKAVRQFHNGRGFQKAILGDAKEDCGLNVIPTRWLAGK